MRLVEQYIIVGTFEGQEFRSQPTHKADAQAAAAIYVKNGGRAAVQKVRVWV